MECYRILNNTAAAEKKSDRLARAGFLSYRKELVTRKRESVFPIRQKTIMRTDAGGINCFAICIRRGKACKPIPQDGGEERFEVGLPTLFCIRAR